MEGFAQQVEMIKEFEVSNEFEGLVGEQDSNNEKANKIACECDKKAKSCKTTCKNFLRGKYLYVHRIHTCVYVKMQLQANSLCVELAFQLLCYYTSSNG